MTDALKPREAMALQGYRVRREVCSGCANFRFESQGDPKIAKLYPGDLARQARHMKPSKLHCGIGGFSVKRTATCNRWTPLK